MAAPKDEGSRRDRGAATRGSPVWTITTIPIRFGGVPAVRVRNGHRPGGAAILPRVMRPRMIVSMTV